MSKVYGAIIKHRLRTTRNMLRHYWPSLLGLILGLAFLGNRLLALAMGGGTGFPPESKQVYYLLGALTIMNAYRTFIQETPPITVNAATLHHLYHTSYFRRVLAAEHVWTLAKNMPTALFFAGLVDGFRLSPQIIANTLLIGGYLYSGVLLSWMRYHDAKKMSRLAAAYVLSSAGLWANASAVRWLLVGGITLWSVYWTFLKMRVLDISKYYRDMAFLDEMTSVASRFDMARMAQITAERNAVRRHSLLLYRLPLKRHNAVFLKGVISTVRTSDRVLIVLLGFVVLGVLVAKTPLLDGLPFIGDPIAKAPIGVVLIMTAYANLSEILKKQLNTLIEKHGKGLFLPVSRQHLVTSYLVLGSLIFTATSLLAGWLMGGKWVLVLAFCVLYSVMFSLDLTIEANNMKFKRPITGVIRVISLALGFLFVA